VAIQLQLTGGAFQDPAGTPLANGRLIASLSQDGKVNDTSNLASGRDIVISLDQNGNISTSPAQYLWGNDSITPAGTFYTISGYTTQGQLVWGPNAVQIIDSGDGVTAQLLIPANTHQGPIVTYDIGVFLPGQYAAFQLVLLLKLERTVNFATAFAPSRAVCNINPTSTRVFTIYKNSISVGTLTIDTAGHTTFSCPTGVTFHADDVMSIVAPGTVDATLSDIGIVLSGTIGV
jgi:hypothetical protein